LAFVSSVSASSVVSTPTLRIAYFGLPLGALVLAKAGFAPVVVALGHPDAPGARRVRRRLSRSALVLGRPELEDPALVRVIASARPDVLLSWFWPKRIPEAVLRLAPRGAFGVHPSLLPELRGPDPYFWAILRGLARTGVTLHRLDRDYDTGNVIAARALDIAPHEHAFALAKRLDRPSLALLVSCAERLAQGEALEGEPQDAQRASEAPRPEDELLEIDWREPAVHIARLVRAAAPFPGAHAVLGDTEVDVVEARPFARALPRALEPGDAVLAPEGVVVCTAEGGLLLERVRDENGNVLRGAELVELFPDGLSTLPPHASKR
jgi:methionyl-tRNA formyltransferase